MLVATQGSALARVEPPAAVQDSATTEARQRAPMADCGVSLSATTEDCRVAAAMVLPIEVAAATDVAAQEDHDMAKQQRGYQYLLPRLEKEHPSIYADWKAGKYASPRKALEAAGLKTSEQPLDALKRAWAKASAKDRADFLAWTGSASASGVPLRAVDGDRRLTPAAAARIKIIMDRRRMTMGDVMDEMQFSRLNASLGRALSARPSRLEPEMVKALEKWLKDNNRV